MKTPTLFRLQVEGFRAINKSDIIINGITVVTGENGCGKSTLSKMLYYLFKTTSDYELLVAKNLNFKLSSIKRFLEISINELFANQRNFRNEINRDLQFIFRKINTEVPDNENLNSLNLFIDKINLNFDLNKNETNNSSVNKRLSYIANDILEIKKNDLEDNILPFEQLKSKANAIFKEAFGLIDSRSTSLLKDEFKNVFHDDVLPTKLDFFEFDESIVSLEKNHLSIPYAVQNVIYIDKPMMIGIDFSDNEYWEDLNELLAKKKSDNFNNNELATLINNQIINGEAIFDDDALSNNDFSYKRKDGSVFNLLDCATGIKSFSILQLLLKNGSINNKTLLIVDEPESHLHPQWIIEYARLLVLISKKIGTKIFIASHNPDMVSALKFISAKEETQSNLNFYLAKKNDSKFNYDYQSLGTDIEPIFESFNIAIDRMNLYSN